MAACTLAPAGALDVLCKAFLQGLQLKEAVHDDRPSSYPSPDRDDAESP